MADNSAKPINEETVSRMLHVIAHGKFPGDTQIKAIDVCVAIFIALLFYGIYYVLVHLFLEESQFLAIASALVGLFSGLIGSIVFRYRRITAHKRRDILIMQLERLRLSSHEVIKLCSARTAEDSMIRNLLMQLSNAGKPK